MAMGALSSLDCFECSVCLESMLDRRPVALSCLHTFCTPCIKELYKKPPLTCPTCRRVTKVPGGTIEKLPINRDLVKIMESGNELFRSSEKFCDTCMRKGQQNPSVGICVQCTRKLCQSCVEQHSKIAVFKNHQVVLKAAEGCKNDEGIKLCQTHKEAVQFVCMHCMEALCIDCINDGDHTKHEKKIENFEQGITNIRIHYSQERANVKGYLQKLNDTKQEVCSDIRLLSKTKTELRRLLEMFQTKVSEVQGLMEKVSLNETLMTAAESEISKRIGDTKELNTSLMEVEKSCDMVLLSKSKSDPINVEQTMKTTDVIGVPERYKIPIFDINQFYVDNDIDSNSVGTLREVSHGEYGKAKKPSKQMSARRHPQCSHCRNQAVFCCITCKRFICKDFIILLGSTRGCGNCGSQNLKKI